jgi:hypothetical protein
MIGEVTAMSWLCLAICAQLSSPGAAGSDRGDPRIDFSKITGPVFLSGDETTAYRDPAACYHDGVFRVFHSLVRREDDGHYYWYLGVTESRDLVHWTRPRTLTPRDLNLNFSSPGNVVRVGDRWLLCLQTYPTPNDEVHANDTARIWLMESQDLVTWGEPKLIRVKGPDVPREEMGRMIDPYLVRDKDDPNKWWCFYKQDGVSMSYTYDFETWTYFGRADAGENVCVLVDGDEYVLIHSPGNGVGVKRSRDLKTWRDVGLYTLGQEEWPWAQGRLTAAQVLDLREEPRVGRYLMFFHGSSEAGKRMRRSHGHASLALAWSDDLVNWEWGK